MKLKNERVEEPYQIAWQGSDRGPLVREKQLIQKFIARLWIIFMENSQKYL